MTLAPDARDIDTSVLVTTYRRPRHLALVLESIALQWHGPPRFEVVVADDGSEDSTAEVVEQFAAMVDFPVRFTSQRHDGFRLARVRNNAFRQSRGSYLLFLDGDCILPRGHLAAHLRRRRPGQALLGHCARLPEETSEQLIPENLAVTSLPRLIPAGEARSLARRHRRAWWHNLIRHPSKPRLTGGDFSVWRADFERVNGFDERFVGWGQEDDDLGLRLRATGVRLESILDQTCSLHVWHPTDPTATTRWRDGANVAYFERRGRLTACRQGLTTRGLRDILWGMPADLPGTPLGRLIGDVLADAPRVERGEHCEVDILVAPTTVAFSRPSECRLILTPDDRRLPRTQRQQADRIITIDPADRDGLITAISGIG